MSLRACLVLPQYYYGPLLIAGILESNGVKVSLKKDLTLSIPPSTKLILLGFYSTNDIFKYWNFVQGLKKKDVLVVAGGVGTLVPELILKYIPRIDVVIVGEAEETIVDIIDFIRKRKPKLEEIEGIAFMHDGEIVKTKRRGYVNLENRPIPLIPKGLKFQDLRGANIYLETHRGCPGNCSFCLVPFMFGHRVRSRPLNEIVREVEAFNKKGAKNIAISGGVASLYGSEEKFLNEEAFFELLKNISRIVGKENFTAADLRVDMLTPKVLEAIKRFTKGYVSFGLESGSDKILRSIHKGFSLNEVYEGVEMTKNRKLKIIGSFITGFPQEGGGDLEETEDLIRELKLYDYAINIAEPLPGTRLFEEVMSKKKGEIPVFQESEEKLEQEKLSVAEYRAITLKRVAYETMYGKECPSSILNKFITQTKKEGNRIRRFLNLCFSLL